MDDNEEQEDDEECASDDEAADTQAYEEALVAAAEGVPSQNWLPQRKRIMIKILSRIFCFMNSNSIRQRKIEFFIFLKQQIMKMKLQNQHKTIVKIPHQKRTHRRLILMKKLGEMEILRS